MPRLHEKPWPLRWLPQHCSSDGAQGTSGSPETPPLPGLGTTISCISQRRKPVLRDSHQASEIPNPGISVASSVPCHIPRGLASHPEIQAPGQCHAQAAWSPALHRQARAPRAHRLGHTRPHLEGGAGRPQNAPLPSPREALNSLLLTLRTQGFCQGHPVHTPVCV